MSRRNEPRVVCWEMLQSAEQLEFVSQKLVNLWRDVSRIANGE